MTALHKARGSAVMDRRCAAESCVIVGYDKVEKRLGRKQKKRENKAKTERASGVPPCQRVNTNMEKGMKI